jgi:hypothetical protein
LTQLTKKGVPFKWNEQCEDSFQKLKKKLIEPPILGIPKPGEKFTIYTNASHTGLGGVLMQEGKVVASHLGNLRIMSKIILPMI